MSLLKIFKKREKEQQLTNDYQIWEETSSQLQKKSNICPEQLILGLKRPLQWRHSPRHPSIYTSWPRKWIPPRTLPNSTQKLLVLWVIQWVIQGFVHPIPQNYCTAHQTLTDSFFLYAFLRFSVIEVKSSCAPLKKCRRTFCLQKSNILKQLRCHICISNT